MLGNLKQQLGGGLASYKKVIFIILLAAVFIVTAVYVYKKYISDKNSSQPKKQTCATGESKSADLYLFYTEWCPHCKKTKPEWEQLKKNYSGNNILKKKLLLDFMENNFLKELKIFKNIIIVPLGTVVSNTIAYLNDKFNLNLKNVLHGFPHPSGLNIGKDKQFDNSKINMLRVLKYF